MSDTPHRKETLTVGIASITLGLAERDVPDDEPPALPPNAQLSVVGKATPRWDGRAKVTGAARFTADISLPGMIEARILRSPHPHARVLSVDVAAAERHPGVKAVVLVRDLPGKPAASAQTIRYAGAPIAAVAATSRRAADQALRLIEVAYDPLPFVVAMEDARAPGAPVLFDSPTEPEGIVEGEAAALHGNLRGPDKAGSRGNAEAGFTAAEIVVEGEFRTQAQTPCSLEPHGLVADWRTDGLTVHISTQSAAGVREELARIFGLPLSRIRVLCQAMGGGFGSKLALGLYGQLAVALSRKAALPVRLVLDRREEQIDGGNRPATWQRLRLGARKDGSLAAVSLVSYGSAGTAVGAVAGNIAAGLYLCPDVSVAQHNVFTNASPGCPMRGPGNVPGAFAMEQLLDELAERLAMDPVALRDRIDPSPARREERHIGAERIGWSRRHAAGTDAGPVKTGMGMAQSHWPAHVRTNAACELRVLRDGSVELRSSVQDTGSGIGTVLMQVVAEELGLKPADITLLVGDTEFPAGPPSDASQTTASLTPPARAAAHKVRHELFRLVAEKLGVSAADLVARDGRMATKGGDPKGVSFAEAASLLRTEQFAAFAARVDDYGGFRRQSRDAGVARTDLGGVQFATVSVDTETGIIRVRKVVALHDCGRPINPLQIESQIHSGIVQGVSFALLENRLLDRHSGRMLNADFKHYKLAGAADAPVIEVGLLENYLGQSATDAYGVADPAIIATAPAIANAVYNAIGVRLRSLPMTPAAVLAALNARG